MLECYKSFLSSVNLSCWFDSKRMADHKIFNCFTKGLACILTICLADFIPHEWWIMMFFTISYKGKRVATFITIYFSYLIPCRWQIMRFLTILHNGRQAVTFITINFGYLIPHEWRIITFSTICIRVGEQPSLSLFILLYRFQANANYEVFDQYYKKRSRNALWDLKRVGNKLFTIIVTLIVDLHA